MRYTTDKTAETISQLVNNMSFDPLQIGVELTTDHRYLVGKIFQTFLHFAGQLSRDYEKGYFDQRNEMACKLSNIMIKALENENAYNRKYLEDSYDKALEKSFD